MPRPTQQIRKETLSLVRGTVQADILKEDQAQNTCIFSTEFALRMMGDVQQFFIDNDVRNFYSVSISGYHIAEAGANPISQLAFTLANGFTIVEYYLARGMKIDDFAPNLSFFFSNGMDPEYAVIGRVARRIWARAMRELYRAGPRSQMLKYHIQTSGRSLHAQEIQFNDIRTTLQALYALFDNCNSLHTNAYDEAITTPTEESVRRAVAIQLIIDKELGLNKTQNPWQGSFAIDQLTDLVEEAVYREFDRISERGGVLGAMETMYQRGKIQEESLYYETQKHDGTLPIIGVNTFLAKEGSDDEIRNAELIRSTDEEKQDQVAAVRAFLARNAERASGRARAPAATGGHGWERVRRVDGGGEGRVARVDLRRAVPGRRAVPAEHVSAGRSWSTQLGGNRSEPRGSGFVRAGRRKPVHGGSGRARPCGARPAQRITDPEAPSRAPCARPSAPALPSFGFLGRAVRDMDVAAEPHGWVYASRPGTRREEAAAPLDASHPSRCTSQRPGSIQRARAGARASSARSGSPSRASIASRAASRSSSGSRPAPSIDGSDLDADRARHRHDRAIRHRTTRAMNDGRHQRHAAASRSHERADVKPLESDDRVERALGEEDERVALLRALASPAARRAAGRRRSDDPRIPIRSAAAGIP